jgi:hypothetical protein
MFLLFGMLALVGVLFIACTDEQATAPPEPAEEAGEMDFSFTFPGCEAYFEAARPENKARALFRVFDGQIIAVSLVRQVRRNARYGRYDRAAAKAWQLAALVDKKLPARLVDPCGSGPPTTEAGAAMLMNDVFELAHVELPDGGLPPAAFLPGGGYGQVDPAVGGTILANNEEAALIADPTSFPGVTGPVTIAFFRIPDPQPGTPDYPIPGYQAYPEAYDFSGSAEPTGGVDFWMCVVEDALPVPFDNLVIGHDLGDGEAELLTPRLVEAYPGEILDCSNASYQPSGLVNAAPLWLQLAGRLLQPLADQVLGVQPLNAMYFAGKGLGGRGTSFSDFAPVDAGENGTYDITFAIEGGDGRIYDESTLCEEGGEWFGSCTHTYAAGSSVQIYAEAYTGFELAPDGAWDGCENEDGSWCRVAVDANKTVTAYVIPLVPELYVQVFGEGTVTDGGAINCYLPDPLGGSECLATFALGHEVTLQAAPAVPGWIHLSWGGACSIFEPGEACVLTMDQHRYVSATFELFN